uniref:C-type lectin domain-containing protein n=1 Tax=Astyanax mexicanus TaxID=7994 RepID=A0A3B1IU24_ASTMX
MDCSVQNKTCVVTFSKTGVCFNLPCSYNFSFYCMNVYEVVLVQQNKTWQNALDYCRQHYTDLVSLKADNWMKEAVKVTKAAQTAHVWTGLRFLSGQWFWAKGDDLVYQAWSTEGQVSKIRRAALRSLCLSLSLARARALSPAARS